MDDVTFGRNGPYGDSGQSLMSMSVYGFVSIAY